MEKYTMFMDWKNQYTENEYTTQSNLQIQCNDKGGKNMQWKKTISLTSGAGKTAQPLVKE